MKVNQLNKDGSKTVVIAAGGTGGHIFPALAVAKKLRALGHNVQWVGTKAGLEANIVVQNNFKLHYINISGIRGKNIMQRLLGLLRIITSLGRSCYLLYQLKPAVVLTAGGFVSGPVGMAAWLVGKRLLLQEQNSIAGTTNKILACFAEKIFTAFPKVFANNKKTQFTGNPLREEIIRASLVEDGRFLADDKQALQILVIGGSRGAAILNATVPNALKILQDDNIACEVIHQTGRGNLLNTSELYKKNNVRAQVLEFINEDLADLYLKAHILIARAGALTVAEISALGVPSILVPYPHAIDNHQLHNALFLSQNNAAIVIEQERLTAQLLADNLRKIYFNREILKNLSYNAKKLAKIDATMSIVKAML